jgi:hypothetical protein
MKKFIPLLTALVAFSPLAACSTNDGDTARRLDAVEQEIAAIRQQLDEQETAAATPSTVVPASTTPVLEATTAATDSTLRTDEEVRQNSIEACEKYRDTADTYIASLDAPPGIFFHGVCDGDSMWGFAYQGPETDIWYPNVGGRVLFDEEGHFEGDLAAWSGVPLDRHHPAFPDALTMQDMAALPEGSTVCFHLVEGHRSEELRVHGTFMYGYFFERVMAEPTFYPAVRFDSALSSGGQFPWPAKDVGIMPFEDGTWSTSHFTLGRCPSGQ